MKYFSKILIALFILTFACLGYCNIAFADNTVPAETSQTQQPTGQITPTVSDTRGAENEIFSLPNIINIILIAIGIVLILLAIAIYTRIKR